MRYADLKHRQPQAKHITDEMLLAAIRATRGRYGVPHWATTWDVVEVLAMPERVVLAKLATSIRRRLIHGCACGCRGDLEIPGEP